MTKLMTWKLSNMLVYTKFYILKDKTDFNIRSRNENFTAEVSRFDYQITFWGPVEYKTENIHDEAFDIFNGVVPMNQDGNKYWHGISASSGDIFEFINMDDSRIIQLCLPVGWKKVSWIY